jgi:hypothetical protein
MFLIFLSSYAYLHDKFYCVCQASDDIDKDKVNSFVSELCNLLIDSAKTTFGTHKYKTRPDTYQGDLYQNSLVVQEVHRELYSGF